MVFHSEYSRVLANLISSTAEESDEEVSKIYLRIENLIEDAISQREVNLQIEKKRQLELNYSQKCAAKAIIFAYYNKDDLLHDFAVECVNAAHDKLLEIGNDSAVSPAATQGEQADK